MPHDFLLCDKTEVHVMQTFCGYEISARVRKYLLPVSTMGGNRPGRSFVGVKMIPFHHDSFKMLAFNSLLGAGSYKQFPSAAT